MEHCDWHQNVEEYKVSIIIDVSNIIFSQLNIPGKENINVIRNLVSDRHLKQHSLTTMMTHIVVNKSTKPHSICFLPQLSMPNKMFIIFSARELKKALRDKLTRAALSRLLSTTAN